VTNYACYFPHRFAAATFAISARSECSRRRQGEQDVEHDRVSFTAHAAAILPRRERSSDRICPVARRLLARASRRASEKGRQAR